MKPSLVQRNALLDSQTSILLVLSANPSILVLLNEWEGNTAHAINVQYPNAGNEFLDSIRTEKYTDWTWDMKSRKFLPAREDVRTEMLKTRSRLLIAKHDMLFKLIFNLDLARYPVRSGVDFQESVYLTKKIQAQRFKDNGYDESTAIEYPYVLQYADYAGISLKQATDDILFKAGMDDQILAKTELLRLKYFNIVRKVDDPQKMQGIFEEFVRECYTNARV